jgi:hypothetical protein
VATHYSAEEMEEMEEPLVLNLRRKAAREALPAMRKTAMKKKDCTSAVRLQSCGQTCRALSALRQAAVGRAESIPAAPASSVRSLARWSQSLQGALDRYVQTSYCGQECPEFSDSRCLELP